MVILSVVIGFILTGIVGRYIGITFATKEQLNKAILDKVQKDIGLIEEINLNLIQESTSRKYSAEQVIFNIDLSKNESLDESKALEVARLAHQSSIKCWMLALSKNNILLNSLELEEIAEEIEIDIHKKFSASRSHINLALNTRCLNKKEFHLQEARKQLDFAFGATRRISNKLITLKENNWKKFLINGFGTEPLGKNNLEKAPTFILFKSMFYRDPSMLRIRSSE